MTADSNDSYHHGDLAVTLMDLALARISAEGTERLSLRGLAREAGVSPAAPYRHFPSKRCLLAALATRGFRELLSRVQAHERLSEDLEERLLNLGRAYIGFALDRPTTYQIMFGTIVDDFSAYADLAAAAEAAYAPVLAAMAALIERYPHWQMTPVQLGGVTWAAVHGIASLVLFRTGSADQSNQRLTTRSLDALQADTDAALRLLMQGVLHPPGIVHA
ncbi:MAG: TetR/AcrR family transcriptional regulator [Pseudomonadales bacterium]